MKKYTNSLVLNRAYIPVHIVDWKKAIGLIYQDAAKPLDRDLVTYSFDEWIEFSKDHTSSTYPKVSTTSMKIAIPEIIVLKDYDRLPSRDVKFSRQTLFERDGFRCYLCNESFDRGHLTIDHVVPKSKGGKTVWENTITCCKPCNYLKGNKDLSQLNLKPFFMPKKPRWISPLNRIGGHGILESWTKFMDRTLVDMGDKQ